MTTFRKSMRSNKTGECRRLAEHITAAARSMGLSAEVAESYQSASHYVYVGATADADEQIKIRCSDHDDKHGGSDWYCWAGECPSRIIARLADRFGRAVPAGYRPEDYAARSARASTAAAARSQARSATEAEMVATVATALEGHKTASKLAAGKMVDGLYPSIPRAQRQRVADAASRAVIRDRAIAAAGSDEIALAQLGQMYSEARAILRALVAPERFAALRPAGFPRSVWAA